MVRTPSRAFSRLELSISLRFSRLGIATPHIAALLGLTRLFGRVRGLYPDQAPPPAARTAVSALP